MQAPIVVSLGSVCDDLPKSRRGGPEDGPRVDLLTRFSHDMLAYDFIFGERWLYHVPNSKFQLA